LDFLQQKQPGNRIFLRAIVSKIACTKCTRIRVVVNHNLNFGTFSVSFDVHSTMKFTAAATLALAASASAFAPAPNANVSNDCWGGLWKCNEMKSIVIAS
jgi:hypothetical protein